MITNRSPKIVKHLEDMKYALIHNGYWYYFTNTTELFRAWQGMGGFMYSLSNGIKRLAP